MGDSSASTKAVSALKVAATRVKLRMQAVVSAIHADILPTVASSAVAVIYNDDGSGTPSSLISESAPISFPDPGTNRLVYRFVMPFTELQPGSYWIGVLSTDDITLYTRASMSNSGTLSVANSAESSLNAPSTFPAHASSDFVLVAWMVFMRTSSPMQRSWTHNIGDINIADPLVAASYTNDVYATTQTNTTHLYETFLMEGDRGTSGDVWQLTTRGGASHRSFFGISGSILRDQYPGNNVHTGYGAQQVLRGVLMTRQVTVSEPATNSPSFCDLTDTEQLWFRAGSGWKDYTTTFRFRVATVGTIGLVVRQASAGNAAVNGGILFNVASSDGAYQSCALHGGSTASAAGSAASGGNDWHTATVAMYNTEIQVLLDGRIIYEQSSVATAPAAGSIALVHRNCDECAFESVRVESDNIYRASNRWYSGVPSAGSTLSVGGTV